MYLYVYVLLHVYMTICPHSGAYLTRRQGAPGAPVLAEAFIGLARPVAWNVLEVCRGMQSPYTAHLRTLVPESIQQVWFLEVGSLNGQYMDPWEAIGLRSLLSRSGDFGHQPVSRIAGELTTKEQDLFHQKITKSSEASPQRTSCLGYQRI